MRTSRLLTIGVMATGAVAFVACGGGGGNSGGTPTSPTPPAAGGTTVTLTSSGASPRDISVAVGSRVTFQNNDNQPHDMDSDPHPDHTNCPEINVGFIATGQSRSTQNLNTARVCTYHDHNQPSNTSLQGTIRIQ